MKQITLDGEHLTLEEVMTVALAPSQGKEVEVSIPKTNKSALLSLDLKRQKTDDRSQNTVSQIYC